MPPATLRTLIARPARRDPPGCRVTVHHMGGHPRTVRLEQRAAAIGAWGGQSGAQRCASAVVGSVVAPRLSAAACTVPHTRTGGAPSSTPHEAATVEARAHHG